MYTIVTGAAGFIGSNIVKALNERGITRIIAVDNLSKAEKFKNLVDCEIADYFDKAEFLESLCTGDFDGNVDAIFHQGACSNTMESDGRYMLENNYRYSLTLLDWCLDQQVQLLYASSAATYGGGRIFREERQYESPLNVYGYSKFLFDQVVRHRQELDGPFGTQVVGFRYFNVYGPRESHKGRMASVAFHHFHQFRNDGRVKLFGAADGYGSGEHRRDFVHVSDVTKVNLFFYDHPTISGLFNVGTGRAQTFNELAAANVNSCRALSGLQALPHDELVRQGLIEYTPFPDDLRGKYQSFTQADLSKLRQVGYQEPFQSVEEGVAQYVQWLNTHV
ncbi:MAG: ADP-glyceromanno-heptose 6-epimerase [Candidatus Accumulibacter sp.]|nr:ADP-glyceromanno-heptose 6-epimerase [Accumulibacter sp.]